MLNIIDQEVDGHKKAVAYWFTYGDNLDSEWYVAIGYVEGDRVIMVLYSSDGVAFMQDDAPGNDNVEERGTLTLWFHNCNKGVAYYDFDESLGRIMYTPGQLQPKYFNNADNFRPGFATPDDSWSNYWRSGQNQFLGWDPTLPGSGAGAKSLGEELGNSDAFANCQVKKVFRAVCLREPENQADRDQVTTMVTSFKAGYRMKQTFAEAAVYCMGQ